MALIGQQLSVTRAAVVGGRQWRQHPVLLSWCIIDVDQCRLTGVAWFMLLCVCDCACDCGRVSGLAAVATSVIRRHCRILSGVGFLNTTPHPQCSIRWWLRSTVVCCLKIHLCSDTALDYCYSREGTTRICFNACRILGCAAYKVTTWFDQGWMFRVCLIFYCPYITRFCRSF